MGENYIVKITKNAVNDWYEYRGIGYTRAQHHPDRVKACTEQNITTSLLLMFSFRHSLEVVSFHHENETLNSNV